METLLRITEDNICCHVSTRPKLKGGLEEINKIDKKQCQGGKFAYNESNPNEPIFCECGNTLSGNDITNFKFCEDCV